MVKKTLKMMFIFGLFLFLFITLAACTENEIKIISENHVMINEELVLQSTVDDKKISWSVDDENIASIRQANESFIIQGNSVGSCKLILTYKGKEVIIDFYCLGPTMNLSLSGKNAIEVGETVLIELTIPSEFKDLVKSSDIVWSSSDDEVASVNSSGVVTGLKAGSTTISVKIFDNLSYFDLTVKEEAEETPYIVITGKNQIFIGESAKIEFEVKNSNDNDVKCTISNEEVTNVNIDKDNNEIIITGLKEGEATLTIYLVNNPDVVTKFKINVNDKKSKINLSGKNTIGQGEYILLSGVLKEYKDDEIEESELDLSKVIFSSSDERVALVKDGIVLGVNVGSCYISAKLKSDEEVMGIFNINVTKFEDKETMTEVDSNKIKEIMDKMTLEQKIGQMFIVGFSGTTYTETLGKAIEDYHFGNIIYMGANVTNPSTILQMSNDIQNKMVQENGVPAIISTDQEGGNVARFRTKATHFPSNMAVCAANSPELSFEMGKAIGFELNNYGVNMDLAPVLDVNNNPNNPIIGIRSYSDNPINVSIYGNNMFNGLAESGVIGCVKHFPGHGNTATDSHTGLPVITTKKEDLYKIELAPFISSIANGVGAIMTTHILFSAIDNEYPATLSKKVLTNLLRDELGYKGLIVTDGMQMAGVTKFGTYAEVAVMAVNAGVDILTYTSLDSPSKAAAGIKAAVNNGTISMDRINEAVERIIYAKIKYGIMDDYIKEEKNIDAELALDEAINKQIGEKAVTKIKGDFKIEKTDKVLFISVTSNGSLDKIDGKTIASNSLACYAATYLNSKGFNASYYTTNNPLTSAQHNELIAMIKNYDKVVVGFSNVKTSNETPSINFMNEVADLKKENLLAVALNTPYDLLAYNKNVTNYVCIYCNQNTTIVGFSKYMAGEIEATGVSPVDINLFN